MVSSSASRFPDKYLQEQCVGRSDCKHRLAGGAPAFLFLLRSEASGLCPSVCACLCPALTTTHPLAAPLLFRTDGVSGAPRAGCLGPRHTHAHTGGRCAVCVGQDLQFPELLQARDARHGGQPRLRSVQHLQGGRKLGESFVGRRVSRTIRRRDEAAVEGDVPGGHSAVKTRQ